MTNKYMYFIANWKMFVGINLTYITISRVGRLVELMGDAKVGIDKDEMIEEFERDITRVQLSSRKRIGNMTPEKFYKDVIKGDSIIKKAYRSYYLTKMTSLKAADIKENLLG